MIQRGTTIFPPSTRVLEMVSRSTTTALLVQFGLLLAGRAPVCAQSYMISTFAGGVPPFTPVPGLNASVSPFRIATDGAGNIFFTSLNCVFKLDQSGVLTRLAGTSRSGYSGDGGPATTAQLNNPAGLSVDKAENIYVADLGNNRIRKIASTGTITTVAGNGSGGYSGDGGPAINAGIYAPNGLAIDGAGNIYVVDNGDGRVRMIATTGIITTIAGNGSGGYSGDGGPATSAQLSNPEDIAMDGSGNLYISDWGNFRIRKVSAAGIITTVAGNGSQGSSGDGGPALSASIDFPDGLAVDSRGNLYIADGNSRTVRMVSTSGIITSVIAGTGYSGDGGPASGAGLTWAGGLAFDSVGNLYIADSGRVRKVSTAGIISSVAGNGNASYSGDGGPAANAQLNQPDDIAVDSSGNIYVADTNNERIRKISTTGNIITVAGSGANGYSGDDGLATQAALRILFGGVAVDKSGNIYIADYADGVIRKVTSGGIITTVAGKGSGNCMLSGDGGQATSAQLCSPTKVAVDNSGNLYIADSSNYRVRKVSASGIITTIAGNGTAGYSGDGGPAVNAQLNRPVGVAVDNSGNVYIADDYNFRVRKVSPDGTISTFAGSGFFGYGGDGGPATSAYFGYLSGLAIDNGENLYIADADNNRIRKVTPSGIITTIAGNGAFGYSGDGGPATSAQLGNPTGMGIDSAGNLYIADLNNNAVRLLQPGPALSISSITNAATNLPGSVAPGEIVSLFGSGIGPAQLVQFHVNSAGDVDTQLSSTTVSFNGTLAPIVFTSATQVAAVVPYEISGGNAQVIVTYQGQTTAPTTVPVASSAPGVFTLDSTGKGQAAVVNQDGSINSAGHPAPLGSIISLFATGEGSTSPTGVDGKPAQLPLPRPLLPVTVIISGQTVTPLYAGGAPGEVAGVMQVNVRIPTLVQPGTAVPITLQVGNNTSAPVTIAVSSN
jgi:trimeric autotransporter adhesin